MKKSLWIFLLLSSTSFGAEFLEFGERNFTSESLKESKWQFDLGLDYMVYPTNLPAFEGKHEKISDEEKYNIYGLHMAFGREVFWGGGFSTTLKLGGFYNKTLERNRAQASEDVEIDLANVRTDHMVYGGEFTASLNYLIETSLVNLQPFVEVGLGSGIGNVEKEYIYKGLGSDAPEDYDIKIDENFNYGKTSLGLSFVSARGILSYIKVTQMKAIVSKRETSGFDGTKSVDIKETGLSEEKDITSASLGFGFYF